MNERNEYGAYSHIGLADNWSNSTAILKGENE